jgi:hypothetical protein
MIKRNIAHTVLVSMGLYAAAFILPNTAIALNSEETIANPAAIANTAINTRKDAITDANTDVNNGMWGMQSCTNPRYPYQFARKARDVDVTILYDIDIDGYPQNIRLQSAKASNNTASVSKIGRQDTALQSDATPQGDSILQTDRTLQTIDQTSADVYLNAAKLALKRWRYYAYIKDSSESVRRDVSLTFKFRKPVAEDEKNKAEECVTSYAGLLSHAGDLKNPFDNLAICTAPTMPRAEDEAQTQGFASLTFDLDKEGNFLNIRPTPTGENNLQNATIRQSEGTAPDNRGLGNSGNGGGNDNGLGNQGPFVRAAIKSLKAWKYQPFILRGIKQERTGLRVDFSFGDIPAGAENTACTHAPFGSSINGSKISTRREIKAIKY